MKSFFIKYRYPLLFSLLFVLISLVYSYPEVFHYTPRSTHQWRQTDSASAALSYYRDGLNFFRPRMHFVMGGEGYVTGAGEAPVFYYFVALFYSIFGPYEGIFRLLSLLTFLLGLYLVGKIIKAETQDCFMALFALAILFCSPIVAFYAFNFVPNIPAQGIAMVGIWYFYLYAKRQKIRFFYWSMLFYALAGLIKISALMSLGVILGIYGLELLGLFKFGGNRRRIFQNRFKVLPGFLLVIAAVLLWKWWADQYNIEHQTSYFLSKTRPIWSVDVVDREIIWKRMLDKWYTSFFEDYLFHALTILGGLLLLLPSKRNVLAYLSLWLIALGCTSFFLLWYRQFDHHDYYFLEMVLLPLAILTYFTLLLRQYAPKVLRHWGFRLALVALLAYNLHYSKEVYDYRYQDDSVFLRHFNPVLYKNREIQAFLKNLGIEYPDKIVSAPDQSPNNSLYVYNLIGWTELYLGRTMYAKKVKEFARKGAKYLIISDSEYLKSKDLQSVLKKPIGNFENAIFVFDIQEFGK